MTKKDVSLREYFHLFITIFKIGLFTIGGGLVMIPVMQKEFVDKQKWVDDEKMLEIFAVSQSLPGVIAINSSIYLGYELYGLIGSIIACLGIVLPSFLCILFIHFILSTVGPSPILDKFYLGVRSAVVALILLAAVKMGKKSIKDPATLLIALFGVLATVVFKLDVAVIVIISGAVAYFYYTYIAIKR